MWSDARSVSQPCAICASEFERVAVSPGTIHLVVVGGVQVTPRPDDKPKPKPNPKPADRQPDEKTGYVLDDGSEVSDPKFIHPQCLVQHGHTSSEHLVYQALWKAGKGPEDAPYRDVSVGRAQITHITGLSKRNLVRVIDRLKSKFAIDPPGDHRSETHTPKMYRVWSMTEILKRRKAAGFDLIYRNRNAVALARKLAPGDSLASPPGVSLAPAPGDNLASPLGSCVGSTEESSSAVVAATPEFDDDARRQLVDGCRAVRPDATLDEIAAFTIRKRKQIGHRRDIQNLVGMLITSVPKEMKGSRLDNYRQQITQQATWDAEEHRRKEAQFERQIRDCRATIADPNASAEDKEQAAQYLEALA